MTRFTADNTSSALVRADRADIWAALTDADLLPRLTPFLRHIDVDGDHWRWELTKVPILGVSVVPTFTELMTFDEGRRIEFHHDPPEGVRERAGVEGWYSLEDADGGTRLGISLGVEVDLPISRLGRPAVTAAMKGVLAGMGRRFSANLLDHLGVRR